MAGTSPGMEQGKSWNLYPRSHAGNETTKKLSGALWAPQATPESGHVLQDSRELIFLITPYECPNILKMLQSHCISHFSPVSARQKRTVTMVGFSRWGAPYPRGEQRQKAPQLRGVILEILTLLSPREQRETAPHTSREHPKQEWTFTLNPPRGRVLHNRNLTEAREGSWQIGKKTLTGVKNTRTSAAPAASVTHQTGTASPLKVTSQASPQALSLARGTLIWYLWKTTAPGRSNAVGPADRGSTFPGGSNTSKSRQGDWSETPSHTSTQILKTQHKTKMYKISERQQLASRIFHHGRLLRRELG